MLPWGWNNLPRWIQIAQMIHGSCNEFRFSSFFFHLDAAKHRLVVLVVQVIFGVASPMISPKWMDELDELTAAACLGQIRNCQTHQVYKKWRIQIPTLFLRLCFIMLYRSVSYVPAHILRSTASHQENKSPSVAKVVTTSRCTTGEHGTWNDMDEIGRDWTWEIGRKSEDLLCVVCAEAILLGAMPLCPGLPGLPDVGVLFIPIDPKEFTGVRILGVVQKANTTNVLSQKIDLGEPHGKPWGTRFHGKAIQYHTISYNIIPYHTISIDIQPRKSRELSAHNSFFHKVVGIFRFQYGSPNIPNMWLVMT